MPKTWLKALNAYSYPVKLNQYKRATNFHDFFNKNIRGDRTTTIQFEDYFRAKAPNAVEVWYEVVFWKLFSQKRVLQSTTNRVVDFIQKNDAPANMLR